MKYGCEGPHVDVSNGSIDFNVGLPGWAHIGVGKAEATSIDVQNMIPNNMAHKPQVYPFTLHFSLE